MERDLRDLNWYCASVIFLSLVDSFFLAPGSSEEEEVEGSEGFSLEDEEVEGIAVDDVEVGGGAGVLRSWTDPPAGSAKGSGGWEVEVRGVSVTRVETEVRVGERDGEGETLFSLLSLASASERVGRAARYGIGTSPNAACSQLKRPSRGIPLSKSKFHLLAASFLAFFNSFLTKRRFSSWSVGPKRALLTLLGLGPGGDLCWLSSSEELEEARMPGWWSRNRPRPLMSLVTEGLAGHAFICSPGFLPHHHVLKSRRN